MLRNISRLGQHACISVPKFYHHKGFLVTCVKEVVAGIHLAIKPPMSLGVSAPVPHAGLFEYTIDTLF